MKISHIALSVSNLSRSIAFYRKHFGLRLAAKFRHKEIGLTIALLKKGDITLELFEFKKHKPLPRYRKGLDSDLRTLGVKHICLEAKNIAKIYGQFKRSGVSLATDLRVFDNGARYFFLRDPDGILIEIMQG